MTVERRWQIVSGDCVEVLAGMDADSVDSIVTDPPYGLKFMGKDWDNMGHGSEQQAWHYRWAVEALRVLKPGGHLLAFGGTRTYHRLASAVEDAGFEIRDQMQWLYGTGFPKSHNISKAIDKKDSDEAERWEGWGTALKPAHEPIVVARKPFKGTVAANVLEHGTGGLNVDATRIATNDNFGGGARMSSSGHTVNEFGNYERDGFKVGSGDGRWPANIILDEEAGAMLDEQSGAAGSVVKFRQAGNVGDTVRTGGDDGPSVGLTGSKEAPSSYGDSGGASRFFYCAKASKAEREAGLEPPEDSKRANTHPTVKPIALMQYLVRMVTPPNGIVLDPFVGSGSTGIAALREGFRFVGIEVDDEYVELAKSRISIGGNYD